MTGRDERQCHGQAAPVGLPDGEEIRVLRSRIDIEGLPPLTRAVTERIICASADLLYATDLVSCEAWLEAAVEALAAGAPVVADAQMTAAGITGVAAICKCDEPLTGRLARTAGISLAAAAVRLALAEAGPGAVWVVGSEPTAIYEILGRGARPTLVIGMPAGFVAAAEAKKALRGSGVPALTNVSDKGGPAVAVAGCLALLREAVTPAPAQVPGLRDI